MQQQRSNFTAADGWSTALAAELDSANTLVLAFGAPCFGASSPGSPGSPFDQLAAAFPRAAILGCSGAGEISGMAVNDKSISVAVVRFEHTRLRRVGTKLAGSTDSFAAGTRLAAELEGADLRAVFVLSEGLKVNGASLIEGLGQRLPADVLITGGLAGDGSSFQNTWVLDGARPVAGYVTAVGLYGERLGVNHGCAIGWSDFGPERRITRAAGNVLYELDGQPALALYKTYLGELAAELPGSGLLFPLSVGRDGGGSLVRTILAVDEAEQSLTFGGDLPQGGIARLMRGSTDKLIESAAGAGRQAASGLDATGPSLVVSVSCVGRRLVMLSRTEEEADAVANNSASQIAHVGFYSYGVFAPQAPGAVSEFHNQTMAVTAFVES